MSDRRSHSSRHSGMEFGRNRGPRLSSNVKNVQRDQHYQGMFTDSERAQWDYYGQSQERRERDQNNFIHPQPKQEQPKKGKSQFLNNAYFIGEDTSKLVHSKLRGSGSSNNQGNSSLRNNLKRSYQNKPNMYIREENPKREKQLISNEKTTQATKILSSVEDIDRNDFFEGLTFETTCHNPRCIALNKVVLIPKGYRKFNMAKEVLMCICPNCSKSTPSPEKFWFFKTYMEVEGKYQNDSHIFELKKRVHEAYCMNIQRNTHLMGDLNFLEIQTRRL